MSAQRVVFVTLIWENGLERKNGPSVIGASTPRLGPNHREH